MTYSPLRVYEPPLFIVSSHNPRFVGRVSNTNLATNTAWVANLAVYVPFRIGMPITIKEWWCYLGTLTTAHNWDFGIYNEDFTRVQSLGSTAGGTSASGFNNTTTWTDLTIAAGNYYMAFADDSTRNFTTDADTAGFHQQMGVMEQTSGGFALPATATPITYTRSFLPHFGFNCRSEAI